MITLRLRTGLHVLLPSGSEVVLVSLEGAEWVCQYAERVRGEVMFTSAWLSKHCATC